VQIEEGTDIGTGYLHHAWSGNRSKEFFAVESITSAIAASRQK
jgi:hypothetical protein